MLQRLFFAAMFFAGVSVNGADAQRVVDDVARWTDQQCAWLHRQALAECQTQAVCSSLPEKIDFSMSTSRGMTSLEDVLTVQSQKQFYEICNRTCMDKKRPSYAEFRKSFCDRVQPPKAKRR